MEYTRQLLKMVEDGRLDRDQVILACVKQMSEDAVKAVMVANEFVEDSLSRDDCDLLGEFWNRDVPTEFYKPERG